MAQQTKIQWTDATVNFWTGCKKVSPGCKFCYMYRDKERYGLDPTAVVRTSDKTFYAALKWKEPKRIFTCSWSDFFIEEADAWRHDAWQVIRQTPQHTWQILTKRPERIAACLPQDWGEGYRNVWLGVSVENAANFDKRVPILNGIPAHVRFISMEPLIDFIHISPARYDMLLKVQWLIIGGESGNETGPYRYRPCELEWIRHILWNMPSYTAAFVKQLGTHLAKQLNLKDRHGADMTEWEDAWLRFREFPALVDDTTH